MARVLSVADYQERGRQLFKAGNYEEALQQFNAAIDKHDEPPIISLLDNRAATFEKLGNHDSSLKDASLMLQLDRRDVRGYLRTGRVLQRSENVKRRELALKVYNRGLKSVSASHEHYKTLQAAHCKLTRALAPKKSVDPFTMLPAEMVDMILGFLEFHQLVRCLGVSKHWKHFLAERPAIWRHIDFSKARRAVRDETITRYLHRGRQHIKSFSFHRHSNPRSLTALLKASPHLETLKLCATEYGPLSLVSAFETCAEARHRPNCDWLQSLTIGAQTAVSLDGVTQIMRRCSGLVTASFDNVSPGPYALDQQATWIGPWPHLRLLGLRYSRDNITRLDSSNLAQLLAQTPNLKTLQIYDFKGMIDLRDLTLPPLEALHLAGHIRGPPGFPCTLRSLQMMGSHFDNRPVVLPSLSAMKELRTVAASGDYAGAVLLELGVSETDFPWQNLSLDFTILHHYDDPEGVSIARAVEVCPQLTTLHLNGHAISDEHCEQLARDTAPQPVDVSLAGTSVTGFGVKRLVLSMRNLLLLDVSNCRSLGVDAVEWARSRGLKVKHMRPAEGKQAGKKIRHG